MRAQDLRGGRVSWRCWNLRKSLCLCLWKCHTWKSSFVVLGEGRVFGTDDLPFRRFGERRWTVGGGVRGYNGRDGDGMCGGGGGGGNNSDDDGEDDDGGGGVEKRRRGRCLQMQLTSTLSGSPERACARSRNN